MNTRVATVLVAELGIDPKQFPDAGHAASWVGICPGNHQTAGLRKSGKIRKGNRWLRPTLVEAAWAAARSKGTYLAALYRPFLPRKGENRALVAVAHSMLVSAYAMLKSGQPYRELGGDYFDRLRPQHSAKRLVARLVKLGHKVELSTPDPVQPAVT